MKRALVVDDSRAMRMILSKTLVESGFEVLPAGDGKAALEVLKREGGSVSLMLADWNMPEMSGLELVEAVRGEPSWGHIRIVMVTTETEIEQMSKALVAGADEYVMKPFTREVVEDKLRLIGAI